MRLDAVAPTDAQPARFLTILKVVSIGEPSYQTCSGNSKRWGLLGAVFFLALAVFVVATGQH